MEVVFLESGEDLEAPLRRLQLRKPKPWYMRISRAYWFLIGGVVVLLLGGCAASVVALLALRGG